MKKFYDDVSMFVNYSDGRYSLTEVYEMIPWEFMIYLAEYSGYVDKMKKSNS